MENSKYSTFSVWKTKQNKKQTKHLDKTLKQNKTKKTEEIMEFICENMSNETTSYAQL